ncbi:hypothetical protein HAX54_014369, partial [Datura stramonium]|nr:hypothetical protein [Datura stramonium]
SVSCRIGIRLLAAQSCSYLAPPIHWYARYNAPLGAFMLPVQSASHRTGIQMHC